MSRLVGTLWYIRVTRQVISLLSVWMLLCNLYVGVILIYYFDFISVGIDVASKISWARIIRPDHKPIGKPIKIDHSSIESLGFLVDQIKKAEEQNDLKARILLESTGVYHIPLYYYLKESGFEVLILNPLITDSNKNQGIRKSKK